MQAGKKTVDKLTATQMKELLNSIIKDCINYAGDSYADFGEAVTKTLHQKKLVDYGIGKEQEMIQKYGLNHLYCSLKDEHLNMLFEACDYDIWKAHSGCKYDHPELSVSDYRVYIYS